MTKVFKYGLFLLALLLIMPKCLSGQTDTTKTPDSGGVPRFTPDADISIQALRHGGVIEYDYGFFPRRLTDVFAINFSMKGGGYSWGNGGVKSEYFGSEGFDYTDDDPFDRSEDEHLIMKEGELDSAESEIPGDDYGSIGLDFYYMTPLPISLKANVSWVYANNTALYHEDKSKSYLGLSGAKKTLKEVDVLIIEEKGFSFSADVVFDVWGGSKNNGMMTSFSTYFLSLGYAGNYQYKNESLRYTQIANAKEVLRYDNLCDTLQHFEEYELPNTTSYRDYFKIGIGTLLGTKANVNPGKYWMQPNGLLYSIGASAYIPRKSMFIDTNYKSWIITLDISVGLSFHIGR